MNPTLSVDELIARLDELGAGTDAALCFDADGTLWSGDVGEDVFRFACERGLLKDAALPVLQQFAFDSALAVVDDVNQQAQLLFDGYLMGALQERCACELMAVGFAGWQVSELEHAIVTALDASGLSARLFQPLKKVFDWAQRTDTATFVISASPDFVVQVAARHWGFAAAQVQACTPARNGGVLQPQLAWELPYGDDKVRCGRRLLQGRRWLASFGDSGFDGPMLQAAAIGVAVRPKASLRAWMKQRPSLCLLDG